MIDELREILAKACSDLFQVEVKPTIERTEERFGDYASNAAFLAAARLAEILKDPEEKRNTGEIINVGLPSMPKTPRDYAEEIKKRLNDSRIKNVEVAGPGFINLTLTDQFLWQMANQKPAKSLAGQTIVAEYSDPNPFKILHAGHLYTSVVGDAIANLLENAGASVHRVNFGGDVGLHVAKTIWATLKELGGEHPENLIEQAPQDFAEWTSARYIEGNEAYEIDEHAKAEIVELNKRVYELFEQNDHDTPFAKTYWTIRAWSYVYFDWFYGLIGTKFEKYYPESETAPLGLATVKKHLGDVYEQSDGAVIFDGEKYGLHKRVFINSQGLPTYEAKDVGLIMKKWQDYHFDRSVVITGNDIIEYMKVVLKSIEQFEPKLAETTKHLTHGMVKLQGGQKMSSRKGNILRATDVLEAASEASGNSSVTENSYVVLGAVKYAFLKNRMGGDIVYDPAESVSIEGNSGPYLQYAHARARSILAKASQGEKTLQEQTLQAEERSLLRKIGQYPEVVAQATAELMPHHVCTYLYELAQTFNRFYESSRIIGDPRQELRIKLVEFYSQTLKDGLSLLGIEAPERM